MGINCAFLFSFLHAHAVICVSLWQLDDEKEKKKENELDEELEDLLKDEFMKEYMQKRMREMMLTAQNR